MINLKFSSFIKKLDHCLFNIPSLIHSQHIRSHYHKQPVLCNIPNGFAGCRSIETVGSKWFSVFLSRDTNFTIRSQHLRIRSRQNRVCRKTDEAGVIMITIRRCNFWEEWMCVRGDMTNYVTVRAY